MIGGAFRFAGAVLRHAASACDIFAEGARALAGACDVVGDRRVGDVECPYCQEVIHSVDDHVVWCDFPAVLAAPLADAETAWPIVRCGRSIEREFAMALTRAPPA